MDAKAAKLRELSPITGAYKDKQVLVVAYEKFLDQYSFSTEVETLAGFPENTIIGSKQLRTSFTIANCMLFMQSLVDEHGEPRVQIRSKPRLGAFATTVHKPRSLTIVPAALRIFECDTQAGNAAFFMATGNQRFFMTAPSKKDGVVSIAFCIRSSNKTDECNCVIKKLKSESGAFPSIIECTVIANTKKIGVGEELVYFRDRVVQVDTVEKSVKVSLDKIVQPGKKAKHA